MTKEEFMEKMGLKGDEEEQAKQIWKKISESECEYFGRIEEEQRKKNLEKREKEKKKFIDNWMQNRNELEKYKYRYESLVQNVQEGNFYEVCINVEYWEKYDDE
jgi:hypothetical protein